MSNWLTHFIDLFIESAPWLLLGFLIAGLIKALIPHDWLQKHLGGSSIRSVVKAALIGAPLPLCSCGVVPAALGLRRAGASKAATTAFLISTPETGVDSISITYAFMGPFMAIIRPVAAIVSAITAGVLVRQLETTEDAEPSHNKHEHQEAASCCSTQQEKPVVAVKAEAKTDSCCDEDTTKASACNAKPSLMSKLAQGLRFSLMDLSKDIALWLLVGLALAAAIQAFVPIEWLTRWGHSWVAFLMMTLIGIPMYICATSSTPIAAALLFSGVSPGAVLVFMLVGPATNIATVSLVKQELGARALCAYLSSIIAVSYVFGWTVNYFSERFPIVQTELLEHGMHSNVWAIGLSVLLAILLMHGLILDIKNRLAHG